MPPTGTIWYIYQSKTLWLLVQCPVVTALSDSGLGYTLYSYPKRTVGSDVYSRCHNDVNFLLKGDFVATCQNNHEWNFYGGNEPMCEGSHLQSTNGVARVVGAPPQNPAAAPPQTPLRLRPKPAD